MKHAVVITRDDRATRVVHCDAIDECLDVVRAEGEAGPAGTIINLMKLEGDTAVPMATWGKRSGKLKRGGMRRNPALPRVVSQVEDLVSAVVEPREPEFFADGVWDIEFRGGSTQAVADALKVGGWRERARTKDAIAMKKGKTELQIIVRYGRGRITVDTKP